MRGKSQVEKSGSHNIGIGNSFDELADSLVKNTNFSTLLVAQNFRGSITIHVEPQNNVIRNIDFNYCYKTR